MTVITYNDISIGLLVLICIALFRLVYLKQAKLNVDFNGFTFFEHLDKYMKWWHFVILAVLISNMCYLGLSCLNYKLQVKDKVNTKLSEIHFVNINYSYLSKSGVETLTGNYTKEYLDKALNTPEHKEFDDLAITYSLKNIAPLEYIKNVYTDESTNINVFVNTNIEVTKRTGVIIITDVLKTDVVDSKIVYRIGEYTLYGDDINKVMSSFSNNTNVDLEIVYDKSTESISKYKILSAKTL